MQKSPARPSSNRNLKVAELIQRELAQMLQRDVHQPHWGMVTVTSVVMTPDLQMAKVYITLLGATSPLDGIVKEVNQEAKLLRMKLAHKIALRYTPSLKFYYDETLEKALRLQELLAE